MSLTVSVLTDNSCPNRYCCNACHVCKSMRCISFSARVYVIGNEKVGIWICLREWVCVCLYVLGNEKSGYLNMLLCVGIFVCVCVCLLVSS